MKQFPNESPYLKWCGFEHKMKMHFTANKVNIAFTVSNKEFVTYSEHAIRKALSSAYRELNVNYKGDILKVENCPMKNPKWMKTNISLITQ